MLSIIIVNKNKNGDIICSVDDFKKIINDTYNDGYMKGCQEKYPAEEYPKIGYKFN